MKRAGGVALVIGAAVVVAGDGANPFDKGKPARLAERFNAEQLRKATEQVR